MLGASHCRSTPIGNLHLWSNLEVSELWVYPRRSVLLGKAKLSPKLNPSVWEWTNKVIMKILVFWWLVVRFLF